ncbi:MAG: MFS transporter [Chloroflexi bacterium]|nr:MFS transporter [Chloroflexota bacterium]
MTPFQSPAFRRLWGSSLASAGAQGLERTATAWLALETGGGAFAIGLIFAARMLPSLLFGLTAGTIADRMDRRRQLIIVAGVALLLMVIFSWLIGTGGLRIWQVVAFSFAAGCLQVFDTPARQALVMDTVDREAGPRALALNALATRFAVAFGALGAGALIAWIGVAGCYWVVAGAYGLTAALVASLHVPQARRLLLAPPPFRQAFRDAARLVIDIPMVRILIIAGVACEIFAFSHMSALPLFAQNVLAAGAEGLGTLNAAAQVGGAIAVTLLSLLPSRGRQQPLLGAIFVFYGLSILALGATHNLLIATIILFIIGMCAGAFDLLQQTLIQLAVPDEQRGRAVGLWVLSVGSAPIGHLEMGLLIAALGAPLALLINGGLTLATAIILLARTPSYRWALWTRPKSREL